VSTPLAAETSPFLRPRFSLCQPALLLSPTDSQKLRPLMGVSTEVQHTSNRSPSPNSSFPSDRRRETRIFSLSVPPYLTLGAPLEPLISLVSLRFPLLRTPLFTFPLELLDSPFPFLSRPKEVHFSIREPARSFPPFDRILSFQRPLRRFFLHSRVWFAPWGQQIALFLFSDGLAQRNPTLPLLQNPLPRALFAGAHRSAPFFFGGSIRT